jgi:peptidylprolyl isomerase
MQQRVVRGSLVGVVSVLAVACGGAAGRSAAAPSLPPQPVITVAAEPGVTGLVNPPGTPSVSGALRTLQALQYVDVRVGTGDSLRSRQCVYAHYTGWLADGTKFDSSRDSTRTGEPREPISFPQGMRRVIPGWDYGFEGMRVGGQRRLVIPFPLAYGEAGRPPVIPERASLVFDVELLAVRDTLARGPDEAVFPGAPPQCQAWRELP